MADSAIVKQHYDAIVRTGRVPTVEDIDDKLPEIEPRMRQYLAEAFKEAGHNAMLQRMAKGVEAVAADYGRLPTNIFVGKYPTGSLNAHVMKTVDGPLVLVNTGTEFLIIEMVKLFILGTFRFVDSVPDATDEELQNAIGMNEAEVTEQLARLLYAYVAQGDPAVARKLPILEDDALIAASRIAWATQEFMVAHEYGHIVKNHLEGYQARNAMTNGGELQLNWKSIEQEIEADITALQMCNSITFAETGKRIDTPQKLIVLQMRFAGPVILFALANLIEDTFESLVGKQGYMMHGDHPPSSIRLDYCKKYLTDLSGEKGLEMGEIFQRWLGAYHDEVVDLTRRLLMA